MSEYLTYNRFLPRWFWAWWSRRWHSCWNCGFASESYDHHPSPCWADLFDAAPNLVTLSATNRFRPNFGPVFYRGRLDGSAQLLVVGQDPSTDEQLSRRCFVGQSGQRLQRFLEKAGITRRYVMINTFHLGIMGQYDAEMKGISETPALVEFRNRLMDALKAKSQLVAILTVGVAAREAVDRWPGRNGLVRVHIIHPGAPEGVVLQNWNDNLQSLIDVGAADTDIDPTPYGDQLTSSDIPRRDLPFGTPSWHGTGGFTRSNRVNARELKWTAP